jgi:hypothetical protein
MRDLGPIADSEDAKVDDLRLRLCDQRIRVSRVQTQRIIQIADRLV